MKGRIQRGTLIVCGVGGVVLLLAALMGSREPVHQGHTLSFWFARLGPTNPEAAIALREMGPAAVPFLLKKARSENGDSLYDKLYRVLYSKAPRPIQRRMALPKPWDDPFHYRVANALQLLGPAAVPQLVRGMDSPNSNVRLTALRAATLIGPQTDFAIPALAKRLKDPDGRIRVEAITSLEVMGAVSKVPLADLVGALDDNDRGPGANDTAYVRANAARLLGKLGPEARSALPGLTRLLKATEPYTRVQGAIAIWRIAADTNMVPALIAELGANPEAPTCSWILCALGEMGPVAKPAVSAILRKIDEGRRVGNAQGMNIPSVGLKALNNIDPEVAAKADAK